MGKYKKIVLLIIDGFGVGAMEDVVRERRSDIGANTAKSVVDSRENLKIDNLKKLGLMNILDYETNSHKFSDNAIYTKANLQHFGADSFYGHQEIMGTKPIKPKIEGFYLYINKVEKVLFENKISFKRIGPDPYLLNVNDAFIIGDNIETDPGLAFNITADLTKIEFQEVIKIAKLIRGVVEVPRVIVFGSKDTTIKRIVEALEIHQKKYIGINAPLSGVYTDSYECVHLGYGIDETKQVTYMLGESNIDVTLIGKVGDIIIAPKSKYIQGVDTKYLMDQTIETIKKQKTGLIATNIQETDLAGHSQDIKKLAEKIEKIDQKLAEIMILIDDSSLLIIMADHGNDPLIGHPNHTREQVPIMIYKKDNQKLIKLKELKTMADVGQTIFWNLTSKKLENGNIIKIKA
ncbi:MAG: phosphopentomutase [Spiroplasma sp.]|nr:phosphopentomutase [Mycoplasmatales bacterium]